MSLPIAVERLYQTGWMPRFDAKLEQLPDGTRFPGVEAVRQEFEKAGLRLVVKQNLMFSCSRATWGPLGEKLEDNQETDDRHGTVIGACEREAAVYALAQLRQVQFENQFALVDQAG